MTEAPAAAPVPFTIAVPDSVLDRIRERVRTYDWDALPDAGGWTAGTGLAFMREISAYWTDRFDWRAVEADLNRVPQFRGPAGGLDLHFVHLRGSGGRPLPLVLLHGWPGSFFEFLHLVEPLAHPERFGGDAADGFDVVVPSLPGYAFSDRPARPIGPRTTAGHIDALMKGLGYGGGYLVQGGDWGAAVAAWLGLEHGTARGGGCRAIHINMVGTRSAAMVAETAEERAWAERRKQLFGREGAYFELQSTRPQSLAYAMMDSPVGAAAWILEKFAAWSDLPRSPDGTPDLSARYGFDQLLTNVMLYLVTNSFATASWMYRGLFDEAASPLLPARIEVPVGVAAFPDPTFPPPPRSLAEKAYNVTRWTAMPRGGHFAALEESELLLDDVRAFARTLR